MMVGQNLSYLQRNEKKAKMDSGSTYLEVIFVVDVCVLVQRPIVAEPQHLGEDVLLPQLPAHPG